MGGFYNEGVLPEMDISYQDIINSYSQEDSLRNRIKESKFTVSRSAARSSNEYPGHIVDNTDSLSTSLKAYGTDILDNISTGTPSFENSYPCGSVSNCKPHGFDEDRTFDVITPNFCRLTDEPAALKCKASDPRRHNLFSIGSQVSSKVDGILHPRLSKTASKSKSWTSLLRNSTSASGGRDEIPSDRMLRRMHRRENSQREPQSIPSKRCCEIRLFFCNLISLCKSCCGFFRWRQYLQGYQSNVNEATVSEQLKELSRKFTFLHPVTPVNQIQISVADDQICRGRRFSDSVMMMHDPDDESLFEDSIIYAGALNFRKSPNLNEFSCSFDHKCSESETSCTSNTSLLVKYYGKPDNLQRRATPDSQLSLPSHKLGDRTRVNFALGDLDQEVLSNEQKRNVGSNFKDAQVREQESAAINLAASRLSVTVFDEFSRIREYSGEKIYHINNFCCPPKNIPYRPKNISKSINSDLIHDRSNLEKVVEKSFDEYAKEDASSSFVAMIDFSALDENKNYDIGSPTGYSETWTSSCRGMRTDITISKNVRHPDQHEEELYFCNSVDGDASPMPFATLQLPNPSLQNRQSGVWSHSVANLMDRLSSTHHQKKKDFLRMSNRKSAQGSITLLPLEKERQVSVRSALSYTLLDPEEKIDPEFVEKCHAFVLAHKLYDPPISVDEFLETRVDLNNDLGTRIIKTWAYLSCYPPWMTTPERTEPEVLNLHPGVLVRLLESPEERHKDPLCIYSSWDVCSKGLLHFYRSRYAESNCRYHLYRVWKEMMEMGPELSNKLRNLLALGNHPDYNIFTPELSDYGNMFSLAMNVFAKNVLLGEDIGRYSLVLADRNITYAEEVRKVKERDTFKSFKNLINRHTKLDPEFNLDGCELYDQAKMLSSCIYNYFSGYASKFQEGSIIFRPARMHSRPHYELLADEFFDSKKNGTERLSILSAPVLVCNWLSATFYFERPRDMMHLLEMLEKDSNVEVVSIKNEMNEKSLIRVSLIINNLENLGRPSEAVMSSFFIEFRLQYSWAWYYKHQTFRFCQMSKCEPEHLLKSQTILKKEFTAQC